MTTQQLIYLNWFGIVLLTAGSVVGIYYGTKFMIAYRKLIKESYKMKIKNGDVFDIGQTVNGVSEFLWFNGKWYYFKADMSHEYEYDQADLTKTVTENEFEEVQHLINIFDNPNELPF